MLTTKPHVICEISNQDFGLPTASHTNYRIREASRGLLIHESEVALIYLSRFKYHKLPGGGIEKGETPEQAFHREILEETGCHCQVTNPNAITIEYRDNFQLTQISHIFFGRVTENTYKLRLDQYEIEEGSELKWIPIKEVEVLLKNDSTDDYEGKFIRYRDLKIWKFYIEIQF